ncbi:arabinose transporter [Bifidobacterium biavatii DSM 23969]|uniref:Arabinose transporter n=1 Tax=Bifidobacterium biavatii DSM 23969 TaxID=1437608 RepID=A0A086ZQZ7_9BIFI|nr:arabinose transporter [Bifidobacterium biavatii DSM 23969]
MLIVDATRTRSGSRFFTVPVVTLIALTFLLGLSEFIVVGVMQPIASDMRVSLAAIGSLVSAFALVYAPMTPLGATVSAKFNRFYALMAMTGIFLAGNVLCAFALNYPMLLVGRIVIATVSGPLVAVPMTFAPDLVGASDRPRFMSWIFSGISIAAVFGVPIGTFIAQQFGWRWSFHLINLLTVLVIISMLRCLPRASYTTGATRFLPQFRLFTDVRVWYGMLAVVFGAAATYSFYTYLSPILTEEIGVPERYLSLALTAIGLAALWSNLYSGKLAARGTGSQPIIGLIPLYLLQAVCLAVLPFASMIPALGAVDLLALACLMYLQNSPSQVLHTAIAAERFPSSMTLASSMNAMAFNIGITLGSTISGLAMTHLGLRWLGLFGAVLALGSVGVLVLLKRTESRNIS